MRQMSCRFPPNYAAVCVPRDRHWIGLSKGYLRPMDIQRQETETETRPETRPESLAVTGGFGAGNAAWPTQSVEHCVSRETECYTKLEMQVQLRRSGRRKHVMHGGTLCSKCLISAPAHGQRYCLRCHADYERARRASQAKSKSA